MNDLEKIKLALSDLICEEQIEKWLNAENKAFNSEKPIDLINQGRQNEIWRMMSDLRSGAPF